MQLRCDITEGGLAITVAGLNSLATLQQTRALFLVKVVDQMLVAPWLSS
jgi:hypothetical protein